MLIKTTKFMRLESVGTTRDKTDYVIFNSVSDDVLGYINYFPRWRKYVLTTLKERIFDIKCLEEIIEFIKEVEK